MLTSSLFTFEFSINPLILFAIVAVSMLIGFGFRRSQTAKVHRKLVKAESEMINGHAELLEMQKEYIAMELRLRGIKDPVVVMANPNSNSHEKLPNGGLKKKSLIKDLKPTRNEGYGMIYDNLLNKKASASAAS